jgi:hypothetical protein
MTGDGRRLKILSKLKMYVKTQTQNQWHYLDLAKN